MGFLDRLKRAAKGHDWQNWAAERGYMYEAEAPELAGRFFPPPPGGDTGEKYLNVMRGVTGGRPFFAFQRQMWGRPRGGGHRNYEMTACLALQLPGRPRPDLAALEPEQAFRQVGSTVSGAWQWRWVEPDWLVGTKNAMNPQQLEGELAVKAEQLAAADPSAWQSS